MSGIYIILTIVFVALAALLLIVGMQVLLVIFEIRKVIKRVNTMLEGSTHFEDLVTKERVSSAFSYLQKRLPFFRKRK